MKSGTIVRRTTQDRALFVKLKFWQNGAVAMTAGAGAQAQYAWSGNSLFDPYTTGAGVQPLGFDQYMSFYQRYTVTASKVKVTFINGSSTAQWNVGVMPAVTSSWTGTDWPIFPYSQMHTIATNSSGRPLVIKSFMKTKKIFGTHGVTYNTDDYSGDASNNPTKQWYWLVSAQDPALSAAVSSLNCQVQITYYCKFWQPVQLAGS